MPAASYYLLNLTGSSDYDTDSSTNTTIVASYNNKVFPSKITEAIAIIDTSGLTPVSGMIFSLSIYEQDYKKSKGTTEHRKIFYKAEDATQWTLLTDITTSGRWDNPAEYQYGVIDPNLVNPTGATYFKFVVDDPGGSEYREWYIRALEWDGYPYSGCCRAHAWWPA